MLFKYTNIPITLIYVINLPATLIRIWIQTRHLPSLFDFRFILDVGVGHEQSDNKLSEISLYFK